MGRGAFRATHAAQQHLALLDDNWGVRKRTHRQSLSSQQYRRTLCSLRVVIAMCARHASGTDSWQASHKGKYYKSEHILTVPKEIINQMN